MLAIDKFRLFLIEEKNYRQRTIEFYCQNIGRVLRHLNKDSCKPSDIQQLKLDMKKKGYSPSYINDHIISSRLWGQCFKKKGFDSIKLLPEQEPQKATMSDSEIEAFLNLPPTRKGEKEAENYSRWTIFFSIMAYTGMRPGEVAKLEVDDVDFGRQIFRVRPENDKTKNGRNVPIAPNLTDGLESFIQKLPKDEQHLFKSRRGGRKYGEEVVDNVDWHYNFHSRIKRLGIKRRHLTPYSLRHSFITSMLEEDVNVMKVQKIVGHRKLETTAHYTHLTTKDIISAITKHPLVKKHTDPKAMIKAISQAFKSFGLENDPRFDYELKEKPKSVEIKIKVKADKKKA